MKTDVDIFKFIVKIGKYWGPFPIEGNFSAKICYFAIASVFSVLAVISSVYVFTRATFDENLGVTDIVIAFCNLTILLTHHVYCSYYGKCFNITSWNYLFQNLATLDEFSMERNIISHLVKVICMLAIFLCPGCVIVLKNEIEDYQNWLYMLSGGFQVLTVLQLFYLIVFWCETCNILSSRYKRINDIVRQIYSEDIFVQQKRMEEIKNVIVSVHKTVKYVNEAAGFFILALLIMAFFDSLFCLNIFLLVQGDVPFFEIYWFLLDAISFIVLSIIVIMSCDQVEKKSTEFIQTCIYIQATTGDEQAATLANLANQLRPKFSAAGFFDINQRLLPVFFSNLSTYLIIILQFKISSL
uniref:Gustatory receptor n=1 Tax=Diabrotica virgifera virgifera TaxID=50390 RepID=A0A6P7GH74_DIAVI